MDAVEGAGYDEIFARSESIVCVLSGSVWRVPSVSTRAEKKHSHFGPTKANPPISWRGFSRPSVELSRGLIAGFFHSLFHGVA